MECHVYLKYICLFILCLSSILIYLSSTNNYKSLLQRLNIPFILSYTSFQISSENSTIINETKLELTFESHVSEYYPRLPIHIFTQNLSLLTNTTKLILIGNGFFGSRGWGIVGSKQSSTQIMTSLSCPFLSNYCDITDDTNRFSEADAVVYHMRDGVDINLAKSKRRSEQRFVFALWESPAHTSGLQSFTDFFNWTMTYRFKSDIVTSYYSGNAYIHTSSQFYRLMLRENATRKLDLKSQKLDHRPSDEIYNNKKLGLAAALISNCGGSSNRLGFIKELRKYIDVKIYGRCGEACPSKTNCREFIAQNYYYILSFENSICRDYATEKFFAALEHPIIPVVLGRTNYSHFIPSSGYIDTNQFSTMKSLAEYLNKTRYDKEKYLSYFSWKKDYLWGLNQFFTPFCDLCLRLHLDSKPNVIHDMQKWWFDDACQSPRVLP